MAFDFKKLGNTQTTTVVEKKEEIKKTDIQEITLELPEIQETQQAITLEKHGNVIELHQENEKLVDGNLALESVGILNPKIASKQVIISKIEAITKELENELLERQDEIKMCFLALISQTNGFFYGNPGTAKSLTVRAISDRLDSNDTSVSKYFQLLLCKSTEYSEVFGPISLKGLENDRYVYNTDGRLANVNIFFGDEIWKSNSTVLNGMLTAINEKVFFNDGKEVEIPLISMFAASNEFPDDNSLAALYDRFILRWRVNKLKDSKSKVALMESVFNFSKKANATFTTISIDELKYLNTLIPTLTCKKKTFTSFVALVKDCDKAGIYISDRRMKEAVKVMSANAILNNRSEIIIKDFEVLKYVLWNDEDDIDVVLNLIENVVNADVKLADEYKKAIEEIKTEIAAKSKDVPQYELIKIMSDHAVSLEKFSEKIIKDIKDLDEKGLSSDALDPISKEIAEYKVKLDKYVASQKDATGLLTDIEVDNINIDTTKETDVAVLMHDNINF